MNLCLVHLALSHCALRALGSQFLERIVELSPKAARTICQASQDREKKVRPCPRDLRLEPPTLPTEATQMTVTNIPNSASY